MVLFSLCKNPHGCNMEDRLETAKRKGREPRRGLLKPFWKK